MTFDNDGLLSPAEGILVSVDEFYTALVRLFADSKTRRHLYHEWMNYNQLLRQELGVGFQQWVDGSFVTQKPNPKDIDIVSFIPSYLFRKFEKRLDYFWADNWEREGIDAYLVSSSSVDEKDYDDYTTIKTEWMRLYTRTKSTSQPSNAQKGFLIVQIP